MGGVSVDHQWKCGPARNLDRGWRFPFRDFNAASHPFFSPKGQRLYFFLDHKNLYRVPGPGQNWRPGMPEKITSFPESGLLLEDPQISRDGRQLLYSRGNLSGDIWVLNR
jgi:hypothetical protein